MSRINASGRKARRNATWIGITSTSPISREAIQQNVQLLGIRR